MRHKPTLATIALSAAIYMGSGCQSSTDVIRKAVDLVDQRQADKDAKEAERKAAAEEAERKAADEKEAKEQAERDSEKVYNPPSVESFRKAALWKCIRDGGGPGVALIHSGMYNHVVDAYISRKCLKRPPATAAGAMVQSTLNIQQGIYPIADRGNGGKVHIRAKQAALSGPAYFVVVDEVGQHYWFAIPDLGKRWGAPHPSDKSPFGGPITSAGIVK